MRTIFFILFCVLIASPCSAQDPDQYFEKGYEYMYTQKDSSYYYFEKALQHYTETKDADSQFETLLGFLYTNGYHYDLKYYKKNLRLFEKLIYSDAYKDSEYLGYLVDRLYLEKINYNFKLSNNVTAQEYLDSLSGFQKKRDAAKRDGDYYDIAFSAGLYQGSIYKNQGKFNLALEKYKQLEGLVKKHADSLPDAKNSDFSIKRLKAKTYASLGETDRAILTQIKALDVIKDDPSYANSRLDIQLDLTSNLISTNELKDAKELIEILDAKNIKQGIFKLRLLDQKIALSRAQNNTSQNRTFHQEKLKEAQAYREFPSHPDIIKAYISYADDELYWGDVDSAFAKLKQAKDLLRQAGTSDENFTISKLKLDLAAQYLKTYKATEDTEILAEDILSTSQDIIDALDALQPQFESKLDKQYLIDRAYPALQDAFELMYNLDKVVDSFDYIHQAFIISEKSKAIELRAIRQAGVAQASLDIDPEIVERENLYNYTINQLEKDLFTATENKIALQDSLLQQRESYGDFMYKLRDNHPNYYNLRYQNDIATLSQSIDNLAENAATLSFFQVDEVMYVIKIVKKQSDIIAIPFTQEIQQQVRDYYNAISAVRVGNQSQLDSLSSQLYNAFIASSFPDKLPESLTIIPDGLLHYIPFEALMGKEDYVIKSTTISYKPSVSFMQGLYLAQKIETTFLGFAPRFDSGNDLSLAPLAFNEDEVQRANAFYDGNIYMGDEGSLVRFRESVKTTIKEQKHPIYHLATHAITNDTLPEYSYLAFAPKAQKEEYVLYAKDLYAINLSAAMVVLSACETGLGKIENGQGMQSLAQGFNYAGASSLLYSKWKVSDRYTADIMSLFYENLESGLAKDKALQQAKITYLNSLDDPNLAHPFYWASFVFSGDVTPLAPSANFSLWLIGLGGMLVFGALGWFLKKKL